MDVIVYNEERNPFDCKKILFDTRKDAEEMFDVLRNAIKIFGSMSVNDFETMAKIKSKDIKNNIGWIDEKDIIEVKKEGDKYYILTKEPKVLDFPWRSE